MATVKTATMLMEALMKDGVTTELNLEDVDNENIETIALVVNGFVFVFETDEKENLTVNSYDILSGNGKKELYADQGFNCLISQGIVENYPNIKALIDKVESM